MKGSFTRHTPAVLITGGARRLGLVLAQHSLALGFDVAIHYRSRASEAHQWLAANPQFAPRVTLIQADLTERPREVLSAALRMHPGLVGLVNNAAVFVRGDLTDIAALRSVFDINVFAAVELAAEFFRSVKRGWVINMTDAHIGGNSVSFQNYRLSKRFLEDITRQQALAYAPRVRVNAIAPGAMLPAEGTPAGHFRALGRAIPLRRTGDLGSLRQAYEYLVGNSYVTGQTMFVDGGWHLS